MAHDTDLDPARTLLRRALVDRLFPAAVAEVGSASGVRWRQAFGSLTFDEDATPTTEGTIFDLASLTKPLATTALALQLTAGKQIDLDEMIAGAFPEWLGDDRREVAPRDLLEHASGLAARLVDPPPRGRREFEHDICAAPLDYVPRARSVYSDLGFILLGFLTEDRLGSSLSVGFESLLSRLIDVRAWPSDGAFLGFDAPADAYSSIAPTLPLEDDARRGERLIGRVHDNYAAALGGVAGHSGLFGNAEGVGAYARAMLRVAREEANLFPPFTYPWVMKAIRKSSVPGSSRALGWDTMLPTSSCGSRMSFAAFGHVGFTGTSLWIDPILDRYFVLLTNRACGGSSLDQMRDLRRAFHDALVGVDFDD